MHRVAYVEASDLPAGKSWLVMTKMRCPSRIFVATGATTSDIREALHAANARERINAARALRAG